MKPVIASVGIYSCDVAECLNKLLHIVQHSTFLWFSFSGIVLVIKSVSSVSDCAFLTREQLVL